MVILGILLGSTAHAVAADSPKRAGKTATTSVVTQPASAAKIVVRSDGLYYVSAADIGSALGLSATEVSGLISGGPLNLSSQGLPVTFFGAKGAAGIYFYGKAIDSAFTDANVYWLSVSADGITTSGGEVQTVQTSQKTQSAPTFLNFAEQVHAEQDQFAVTGLFQDPGADYWFWAAAIAGNPPGNEQAFTVRTEGAVSTGTATLVAHLTGGTATGHHALISLNGTAIGEGRWAGTTATELVLTFEAALLKDGDNVVRVTAVLDSGVPYSLFYVESFDLTYQRYYRAVNNMLLAPGNRGAAVTIHGFSNPNVMLLDVTDPNRPTQVTKATLGQSNAAYYVTFRPSSPKRDYLAVTQDAVMTVPITAFATSGLSSPSNSADYLIITVAALRPSAEGLAAYRQTQEFLTKVVDVQAIYDEFNQGIASPYAIRSFLLYAYQNWMPAPRYVLLAGEGSYDYRNITGNADSLVPPIMIRTPYGLFASDNGYADLIGNDGIPEVALGRIPAASAAELRAYVDKVRAFESATGDWTRRALLLADDPDYGGDFTADSEAIASLLPPDVNAQRVYLDRLSPDQAHLLATGAIKDGVGLVNYFGHASVDQFAHQLLSTADVTSLGNGARLPIVAAMTCAVGQFAIPGYDSLSEALVKQDNGGAIAVWAPTGMSIDSEARRLDEGFIRAAFAAGHGRLGDAVAQALWRYSNDNGLRWMVDTYHLLGDPALEMK